MIRRLGKGLAVVFLAVHLCGCAVLIGAAVGGAGVAAWLTGRLVKEVNGSYDETFQAVKEALTSLDLLVLEENKGRVSGRIKSRYVDGSHVWIDMEPITAKTTKVEIRVGVTGNEKASREIMDKIEQGL